MIEKDADEVSVSQVWISSGEYKTNDLNTIEVGWQVNLMVVFLIYVKNLYFLTWSVTNITKLSILLKENES